MKRMLCLVLGLVSFSAVANSPGKRDVVNVAGIRSYVCTSDRSGGSAAVFERSQSEPKHVVDTGSWGIKIESYDKEVNLRELGSKHRGTVKCFQFRTIIPQPPSEWAWRCILGADQLQALSAIGYPFERDNCN